MRIFETLKSLRKRRGANAMEFALTMPMLVVFLAGTADYGWFYWQQANVTNALRDGVRAAAFKNPDSDEDGVGECTPCVEVANAIAADSLAAAGITGITPNAQIIRIPTSGTPCSYAIQLNPTSTHTRLFTLLPGPTTYNVKVVAMAQRMTCN